MAETTNKDAIAVTIQIDEPKSSNTAHHVYHVTIANASGPVAGADALVTLEGPGSLSPAFSAKEQKREANGSGVIRVDWHRRGVFDRDVKATVTITSSVPGAKLSLEEIEPERSTTSYNLPTKPLKF